MSNAIQNAARLAQSQVTGQILNAANQTLSTLPTDKLSNLPVVKNPELIKKQVLSEAEKKKADAEALVLRLREEGIQTAKERLKELVIASIPTLPIPVIDPKILQAVTLAKQAKELIKQRRDNSKNNLKNINKTLEFPMKVPNLQIPLVPTLPEIPKLPVNIPSLQIPLQSAQLPRLG